jgi:WD40 repeat protein
MEPVDWRSDQSLHVTSARSAWAGHVRSTLCPLCLQTMLTLLRVYSAPDNATFTSCGQERDLYLWDVSSGSVLRKFSGHYGRINVVKFAGSANNPGGRNNGASVIVSGSFDAKCMIWDVR